MSYNESLNPNSNYPIMSQSEWDNAPWNEEENDEIEVEVTVSVTLSKTFKIKTKNYTYYKDSEGESIELNESDLKEDVENQIVLPQEAYEYIPGNTSKGKAAIKDLKDWNVDDIAVMEE